MLIILIGLSFVLNYSIEKNSLQTLQMIQGVPTKKQLEQKIVTEDLSIGPVHYSFVKKHGSMLGSVTGNKVLLIFVPSNDEVFYALENHSLPFKEYSNIKKKTNKDTAIVSLSTFTCPAGSTQMTINYPKKEGTKETRLQWKFQFFNKGIAQQWLQMFKNYKEQKAKANYSNINKPNSNSRISENYTKKPQNQLAKPDEDIATFILTDSKILAQDPNKQNNQPSQSNPNQGLQNNPSVIPNNSAIRRTTSEVEVEESRLKTAFQLLAPNLRESRIKPENESSVSNDWNFRFVKDPSREVVYQFQKAAYSAFISVFKSYKESRDLIYKTQNENLIIQITDTLTSQSKKLKNEYRNYHYLLECCKLDGMISVPLACLIEHLGSVCLVKAKLAKQGIRIKNKRQLQQQIFQLQSRTRISNNVLMNGKCGLYDLTKAYGSVGQNPRIYVDDLDQYMPQFNAKPKQKDQQSTFYIRPSLMQYFENRVMPGGNIQAQKNTKAQNEYLGALQAQIRDIAQCLSRQDIYITNIFDLKQFLHYRGVNMKFLYKIYQETKNKFVKRYLQTCLVSKLIKDEIYLNINYLIKQSKQKQMNTSIEEIVEQQIRYFIEGKTATTNQYWKKISISFRNLYGISINTHQLIGGFLLSCLMVLICGQYDIGCVDQDKVIFRDQGIIHRGFLNKLMPKIKSYYKFSSKIVQTVQICKYSEQNQTIYNNLENYLNLKSKSIPESYNVNNSRQYILGYLSDFVLPEGLGQQTLPCSKQIYSLVNSQPPTAPSLKITLNYFNAFIKYLKQQKNRVNEKFEKQIRDSIDIINYWLEPEHPKVCEFLEKASTYKELCGDNQNSIMILEKAIEIAYKSQAKNKKKIGLQHYAAGCQYLKSGKKKQAIQNLQQAKEYLQKSEGQQNQYALTLLKLSSLQLNNGDTDSCIKFGKDALKNAQKGKMSDSYVIKIYEILCRAYQIKGEKEELKKLSLACAREFNQTQDRVAFAEMVKICLTGSVSRLNIDRSKSLLALCNQIKGDNMIKDEQTSINSLMEKAKVMVIMQNFMQKSENSEKYLNEYTTKKNQVSPEASQFINILAPVTGIVGLDFVQGLHDQKQFQ